MPLKVLLLFKSHSQSTKMLFVYQHHVFSIKKGYILTIYHFTIKSFSKHIILTDCKTNGRTNVTEFQIRPVYCVTCGIKKMLTEMIPLILVVFCSETSIQADWCLSFVNKDCHQVNIIFIRGDIFLLFFLLFFFKSI